MKKIIIFLFVGCSSALVDIGALYLFSKIFLLDNILSISISFFLGLIFNYLCHTYITFGAKATKKNIMRYLLVVLFNYIVSLLSVNLLILIGIDIVIARTITLPIIAVITYYLSSVWIYKER